MLDLSLLIEEVLLESILREKIISIYNKIIEVKREYDKNRKNIKNSREELKNNLSNYILKRIELRYELADLIKNKKVSIGRDFIIIKTEKDLDKFIFYKNNELNDFIVIHSSLLPNPQNFNGPL